MKNTVAIAWRETKAYFLTPTAYVVGSMFLVLTGIFFVFEITSTFPEATVRGLVEWASFFMVFLSPLLTMRLLAEEQKLGTLELLLTAPVRDWEVVIGKYLASLSFLLVTVAATVDYVILLVVGADPDPGPMWAGYLGLVLYGATALSIGMLTSTLTSNQIVAAVVALGILLVLYFTDYAAGTLTGLPAAIVQEIGIKSHFDDFDRGVIDTKHVVYYVMVTAFFLFLTVRALESRRWR